MKIATWNINSVRLRLETVLAFLQQADIDVLCLQETKTQDLHFPAEAFAAAGWPHQAIRGEKSYNGVAIIARQPLAKIGHMEWTGKSDCRHIWAMSMMALASIIFMFRLAVTFRILRQIRNLPISCNSLTR